MSSIIFIIIFTLVKIVLLVVPLLICVAYFTLAERKILSAIQRRQGPNVVGLFGLLNPLADGLKLFVKETIIPSTANKFLFLLAPVLTFFLALIGWSVIPVSEAIVLSNVSLGVLYILSVSSLGVYGIILAGWASNSKYAFLGALRSAAQIISYEVSIGFVLVSVLLCAGSLNLTKIVHSQADCWYLFPLMPIFFVFVVSILAETNRHPFDLPEAEAELVSGYNVEYSAIPFALFFLGEYANIILISCLAVLLFLGGWLPPMLIGWCLPIPIWFGLKALLFIVFFIWARAAYPRYRYDQLIDLGWKYFLPLSVSWVIFTGGILVSFNFLP